MKEYDSAIKNNQESGSGLAGKRSLSKNIPELQSDARLSDLVHVLNFLHAVCGKELSEEEEKLQKQLLKQLGPNYKEKLADIKALIESDIW